MPPPVMPLPDVALDGIEECIGIGVEIACDDAECVASARYPLAAKTSTPSDTTIIAVDRLIIGFPFIKLRADCRVLLHDDG